MMTSPWNGKPVRALQASVWPLRTLFVVPLSIAIAMVLVGPDVVKYLVLMIGMTCAFIAVYWEIVGLSVDAPPPDFCTRYHRGNIERVAVSRRGDRFYQCSVCRARYQRTSRGGPLVDASGPEYDALYSRHQPGFSSKTVTQSDRQSIDWGETVNVLLRNKRIRQITGTGGCARPTKNSLLTWMRKPSMAQLREHWRGLWDEEFDG
jgi:hypothetical protein